MRQLSVFSMPGVFVSTQLDISALFMLDISAASLIPGISPDRTPVITFVDFMSFWDRFRRKPKDQGPREDGELLEGGEPRKKRHFWGGFHSGGSGSGGAAGDVHHGHEHHGGAVGSIHHGHHHHGGVGGAGHVHAGGIGG